MDIWYTNSTLEDPVELGLIEQLWMLCPHWLQLYRHFLIGPNVRAMVDVSEGTTTKFA